MLCWGALRDARFAAQLQKPTVSSQEHQCFCKGRPKPHQPSHMPKHDANDTSQVGKTCKTAKVPQVDAGHARTNWQGQTGQKLPKKSSVGTYKPHGKTWTKERHNHHALVVAVVPTIVFQHEPTCFSGPYRSNRRHSRSKPFLTEADKFWRPLPTPRKLHAAMFGSCRYQVRIGSKRLYKQTFGSAYHGLFTTMYRKPQRLPEWHPPGQLVSQKARMRGMLPTTKDQMLKQTLDRSNMFRTCTMQSSYPNVLKTPCKPKIQAKATIQECRKNLPVPCNQLQSIMSITYQSHLYIHSKQGPHTFGHPAMQVCMKPNQIPREA